MPDSNTFTPPSDSSVEPPLENRQLRIAELEYQIRRLNAERARLVAAGEDEKADLLLEQLRRKEADINAGLRVYDEQREAIETPHSLRQRVVPRHSWPHRPTSRPAPDVADLEPSGEAVQIAVHDDATVSPKSRTAKKQSRGLGFRLADLYRSPAWLASVITHVVVLLLLGYLGFTSLQNPTPLIASGVVQGVDEELELLEDLNFEATEIDEDLLDPVELETLDVEVSQLDLQAFESEELAIGPPMEAIGVSDLSMMDGASLMAEIGGGEGGDGGNAGAPRRKAKRGEASFFGAKSRGNRFAFVVDNSGTMKKGRMETALLELMHSVDAMKGDQFFYVIFYSDQPYPLFYPESVPDMVPATRENKRKLSDWLFTVELCQGGELNDAIDMAAGLSPSAVYVLSDGDIVDSRIERLLKTADNRPFPIHTLGMTVRNPSHAANLATIAEAHGGGYFAVAVAPAAVRMSLQRPITYNREAGEVWGTKVRKW